RLEELAADTRKAQAALKDAQQRIAKQTEVLRERQAQLADQLRAQYAGGLSPWAALLSGEDPQDIARELGYLDYVTRARAEAVRGVHDALEELAQLEARSQAQEKELKQLADESTRKRAELDERRRERVAVLERIEAELKAQRGEAQLTAKNEQRLGELVDALGVAIEEAAEARRRAEEARRLAEEKRRAEERRLAEERRQAASREAEEARRSEEARRIAEARRAAEEIRAQEARGAGASADPAPAPSDEGVRIAGRVDGAAPPSLNGLRKGLPYPVRGEVQGRFGMDRPEGGTWRGIVLRASEGVRVGAVAPGRVVYAGWL